MRDRVIAERPDREPDIILPSVRSKYSLEYWEQENIICFDGRNTFSVFRSDGIYFTPQEYIQFVLETPDHEHHKVCMSAVAELILLKGPL